MPSGGSCLLGSINLSEFVDTRGRFDFEDLKHSVSIVVKAMNDVLEEGMPLHPLKEQRESVYNWKQIGIGVMSIADMLIKMGIKYGSKESIDLCDKIGTVMANEAIKASAILAKERGVYPKYNPEKVKMSAYYSKNALDAKEYVDKYGLRNSQLLTIAPTGTISTMLQVSGGIEPIFANYYERKTESLHGHDEYYKVYTKIVKDYMDAHGIEDEKDLPDYFVTAQTIDYRDRINMQAIWQTHIDASISSTINVPNSFTVEQVEDLYMYAWKAGLKGVTIFRDGCARSGILSAKEEIKETHDELPEVEKKDLPRGYIISVDDDVIGKKRRLTTGCGTLHCEAFFDPYDGALLETYLSKGSTGGCQSNLAAVSRLMSLSARAGVDVYSIADQLSSCMACPAYAVRTATKHDTSKGSCCPVAVGNALIDMYEEMQRELSDDIDADDDLNMKKTSKKSEVTKEQKGSNPCPECGEQMVYEGGCITCKSCGYSKCD